MDATTSTLRLDADGRFHWHIGGRVLPFISGGDGDQAPVEDVTVPEDLSADSITVADLEGMLASVGAALGELRDRAQAEPTSVTADDANRATQLAAAYQAVEAELANRASAQQANVDAVLGAVQTTAPAATDGDPTAEPGTEPPPEGEPAAEAPPAEPAEPEQAAVPEGEPVPVAASAHPAVTVPAVARPGTMNPALNMRQVVANAPAPEPTVRPAPSPLTITAAADLNGFRQGEGITDLSRLADAFTTAVNGMAITEGKGAPKPVASIARSFEHSLGFDSTEDDVDAAFDALLSNTHSRSGIEALVAAGGWCAPSEIDYSFFGVEGPPSGQIDLPTIGIRRGGLRWPISLTLADFYALSGGAASGIPSNATMPWEWTETDDILSATGSPTKSCLRPPCPSFTEARLRLWGLCVLAGNLTEDAYPEAIRRFINLTVVAHARTMNRRHILLMLADSTVGSVTPAIGGSSSLTTHVLAASELEATHLRYKYGAPLGTPVELVFPAWARGLMRSDLSKRNGWDDLSVADAFLMAQFDARNIRTQFVEDWQALPGSAGPANTIGASSAPTQWPSTFDGLMYFPGHFFRGNGMNLNLGAIRDSVLNKSNDYTAAWSEEATLIGARGKEALKITYGPNLFTSGTTASQVAATAGA